MKKKAPRVHLICNAHIDPIWQWDWEEGLTETLATFEVAADCLEAFPEFVFNHNEALLYEWTKAYRPALYRRIRKWVRAGRWVISGGWYLQPDCNLPCGESFVRQALVGRTFFRKEFGVVPKVAYNLDPFGHHGNLPQILRKTGYEMYVHFRPAEVLKPLEDFLYRWRGVDGSEIAAMRPPCGWYNTVTTEHVTKKLGAMAALARETGRDVTAFWGLGDHGGGPTRAGLDAIRKMARSTPEITHSSLGSYWRSVRGRMARAPVVRGELQKCFTGCYTSVIGTKQRNRRGEGLALAAERAAALAWWMLGEPYPRDALADVWRRVLFNQFHDILPGSSVREGFRGSAETYGYAFTRAREVLLAAHLKLLRRRTRRRPMALVVFNPRAAARRRPLEVEFMGAAVPQLMQGKTFRVVDTRGRARPLQWLRASPKVGEWRKRMLVEVDLPALGMAEYRIEMIDGAPAPAKAAVPARRRRGTLRLAARHYTAVFNARTGWIDSLRVRGTGAETLAKPGGVLQVRKDNADAWGLAKRPYGTVVGRFRCPARKALNTLAGAHGAPFGAAVQVIESGPLATRIEVVQTYGRSVARIRYTFFANHPEIGIELLLNWTERCRALQFVFPTRLDSGRYTVEIPHAAIERPSGNDEEPCGRWTMLAAADGGNALALVNDGPGGVDVSDGTLRQTLVRSPLFCSMRRTVDPDRMGEHMDLGEHIFRFFLRVGRRADVRRDLPALADDLTMPPAAHVHVPLGPDAKAGLAPGRNLVEASGAGVHLAALKQSEDGRALVARVVETRGRRTRGALRVPGLPRPAALRFAPYEIKTIRIERGRTRCTWKECDLLERRESRQQEPQRPTSK